MTRKNVKDLHTANLMYICSRCVDSDFYAYKNYLVILSDILNVLTLCILLRPTVIL
jgi:hypothetical protein